MILQSLSNYYIRKSRRPKSGEYVAPYGMEYKEIKYILDINSDGNFINLTDIRADGKRGVMTLVPKSAGRSGKTSWQTANLLWDHYGYVLGQPQPGKENQDAERQLGSFIAKLESLPEELKREEEIAAVIKFYKKGEYLKVLEHPSWPDCGKIAGCNMTFRLSGRRHTVTQNEKLIEWAASSNRAESEEDGVVGRCLVTGEIGEIARTHAKLSVGRSQANLVGFQKHSGYDSYGKEQGYNAPVSKKAEFYYTTALNMLLKSDENRVTLGNTTLLFWAEPNTISEEEAADAESAVKALIYGSKSVRDKKADFGVRNAKNIFEAIFNGRIPTGTGDKFCVLGIAPNKARLSVVFWKRGTIKEIAGNIYQYLEDVKLDSYNDEITPSIYDILRASEYQGKMENVPPNMIPAMVYSVFNMTPFPSSVFGRIMERIRAEKNPTGTRVAFLKAYLNRKYRNIKGAEIGVALDTDNKDTVYRLGRLFAVLEKVQEEGDSNIGATIHNKFFNAISSTPAAVLPILMKLHNYHLKRLTTSRSMYFNQLIDSIFHDLEQGAIPQHIPLEKQCDFIIGYRQQREVLYKSRKEKNSNGQTQNSGTDEDQNDN